MERTYTCKLCGQSFDDIDSATIHLSEGHGEDAFPFERIDQSNQGTFVNPNGVETSVKQYLLDYYGEGKPIILPLERVLTHDFELDMADHNLIQCPICANDFETIYHSVGDPYCTPPDPGEEEGEKIIIPFTGENCKHEWQIIFEWEDGLTRAYVLIGNTGDL